MLFYRAASAFVHNVLKHPKTKEGDAGLTCIPLFHSIWARVGKRHSNCALGSTYIQHEECEENDAQINLL